MKDRSEQATTAQPPNSAPMLTLDRYPYDPAMQRTNPAVFDMVVDVPGVGTDVLLVMVEEGDGPEATARVRDVPFISRDATFGDRVQIRFDKANPRIAHFERSIQQGRWSTFVIEIADEHAWKAWFARTLTPKRTEWSVAAKHVFNEENGYRLASIALAPDGADRMESELEYLRSAGIVSQWERTIR